MKLLLSLLLATSLLANEQIQCLALNIYHEARGSSYADQLAVTDVVLNRVDSKFYPNTPCEVVKQGRYWKDNPVKHQCQFSWYCDGRSDRMLDLDARANAILIATQMYKFGKFRNLTEGSLMYHASYINPYWAKSYQLVGTIGKHKFYRISKD
jgi:N-acetylmuramoyl-L-alanine amidase